ncbi:MAG: nucleoside transporter C-terminal domain-containing protein, partial [Myxococcota bacterium]|nr:nucleoside transporter C-terminal domain-containing protein [Myxococcota bacterium]
TFIGHISPPLKTVAFWVLPSVIFFSALMSVLYHYGIMQRLVVAVAWVMQRTMGTSGAESLSAAANIFVGQTEAPLMIRPFVKDMTQSELHAVMVGGFATVAGGVMAIYVGVLGGIPGIAGHLVIASIMSAPAALAISKLMVPETEASLTQGSIQVNMGGDDVNGLDALSRGTLEGLQLALNIAAMLVVFVAMIAMVNGFLSLVGGLVGLELTLEGILGWIFSPVAFLMGVPWQDCAVVGQLLGEKLVLTELIAFFHLSEIINGGGELTARSQVIASYALCGFANFASIGIQIGGIGGIAPERRGDLARIGLRAMIGGTLAAMMTGTVAGIMYTG